MAQTTPTHPLDDQQHVNDEFDRLTSPSHYAQDAPEPTKDYVPMFHRPEGSMEPELEEVEKEGREHAGEEIRDKATERIHEEIKNRRPRRGAGEGAQQLGETAGQQLGEQGAAGAAGAAEAGAGLGELGTEAAAGAAGTGGAGTGAGAGGAAAGAGISATQAGVAAGAASVGADVVAAEAAATVAAGTAGVAAAETGVAAASAAAAPETAGISIAAGVAVGALIGVGVWSAKHWKGVLLSVGILFLTAVFGFTYLLNLFKPIVTTLQTGAKFFAPVQAIVENRSTQVLSNYIFSGSKAAQNAGHAVTTGKLGELFKALRSGGFEDALKNNYGLSFSSGSAPGSVKVTQNGQVLGTATNAAQATQILHNNASLVTAVTEQEHIWNWAQHFEIARKGKGLYQLPQLNVPGASTATDGTNLADVVKYKISSVLQPSLSNLSKTVTCFTTNTACNDSSQPVSGEAPAKKELQDNSDSSIQVAAQDAYDQNLADIKPENDFQTTRLDDKANQNMQTKLNTKSISLLGWLDMSTGVNVANNKDDYAQVTSKNRSQDAGSLWTWWWSASGQELAGSVTPQVANVINRNFLSVEDSQGYNFVAYDDPQRGQALPDDEKVNSNSPKPLNTFYNAWVNLNADFKNAVPILSAWKVIRQTALGVVINIASKTPLADLLSNAVTKLPGIGKLFDVFVASPIQKITSTSFGLSSKLTIDRYDPADETAQFGNYLSVGAHQASNDACEQTFGCGDLNQAQLQDLQASYPEMQARDLAALPLSERLFNRAVPNSFINMAILRSPIKYAATRNVAAAFANVFGIIKNLPGTMASIFGQPARAAGSDPSVIGGIPANKGIPLSDLHDMPLSSELSADGGQCPPSTPGVKNMCVADTSTVNAWLAATIGYDAAVAEGL